MKVRIDPLDKLVSEYIRRKANGKCERCGRDYDWKKLQCCHMFSRRYHATRYDPDNLCACDFGCHQWLDSNPIEKIDFFKKRLGEQGFELLQARSRNNGKDIDRAGLTLYFQVKLKELK